MAWTYDPTEPTARDQVRGRIGDVDEGRQLLPDETLDALLGDSANVIGAAIEAVRRILALKARDADRSAGGITNEVSQVIQNYKELLARLERSAGLSAQMFGGGVSRSGAKLLESDTDFRRPPFRVGMDDIPGGLDE